MFPCETSEEPSALQACGRRARGWLRLLTCVTEWISSRVTLPKSPCTCPSPPAVPAWDTQLLTPAPGGQPALSECSASRRHCLSLVRGLGAPEAPVGQASPWSVPYSRWTAPGGLQVSRGALDSLLDPPWPSLGSVTSAVWLLSLVWMSEMGRVFPPPQRPHPGPHGLPHIVQCWLFSLGICIGCNDILEKKLFQI